MMNSFSQLISKRRSIRKFTEQKIEPEKVELILKAGLKSPSSKNGKPWHFIAVEDTEILEKLSRCKKGTAKMIAGCPLAIVVTADPIISTAWIEDASIASILMQLQAEDLNIGSCWVQVRERLTEQGTSSEEYVKDILNIPMQLQVLCIIALGYKAQEKSPIEDENLEWNKVHIGKFQYYGEKD